MRTQICLVALLLVPMPLLALDVSFAGAKPEAMNNRELKLGRMAEPFEPVVIEYLDAATACVVRWRRRRATDGRTASVLPLR